MQRCFAYVSLSLLLASTDPRLILDDWPRSLRGGTTKKQQVQRPLHELTLCHPLLATQYTWFHRFYWKLTHSLELVFLENGLVTFSLLLQFSTTQMSTFTASPILCSILFPFPGHLLSSHSVAMLLYCTLTDENC